jgi:hypothetical protein
MRNSNTNLKKNVRQHQSHFLWVSCVTSQTCNAAIFCPFTLFFVCLLIYYTLFMSTNTTVKFIYNIYIFYILPTFRCALLAPVDYSAVLIMKRDYGDSRSLEMSVKCYKSIRCHMREDKFTFAIMIISNSIG